MKKCTPVELRKAIVMADTFAKAGIDFVPVPVLSVGDKADLVKEVLERLEKMEEL